MFYSGNKKKLFKLFRNLDRNRYYAIFLLNSLTLISYHDIMKFSLAGLLEFCRKVTAAAK